MRGHWLRLYATVSHATAAGAYDGSGHGFAYVSINFMRAARPRYLAFAGIAGLSLHNWYSNHIFCGHCGRPMVHSESERMVHCDHCHTMIYPRICPAVIVAVRHGDKLLVSKYAGREYKNIALLAGFAEVGETIEETVHREVMEEVGIKVKNLQFYKSQPWCFTDTLLFGFFCDLDGDDTLKVDHGELATAGWIDRQDIPEETKKQAIRSLIWLLNLSEGIRALKTAVIIAAALIPNNISFTKTAPFSSCKQKA